MNWDIAKGNWKQFKGTVKQQWGKLTDDDLMRIEGDRDRLVGSVQERYGMAKDDAERQVLDWEARQRTAKIRLAAPLTRNGRPPPGAAAHHTTGDIQ